MQDIQKYLKQIKLPESDSHKGQNGKLLIIGGSELFHAASKWSLDIASRFVDMLFYSSLPENNQLIKEAKGEFWNGIVVPRGRVEEYIKEADAILIGPGMDRSSETEKISNSLLEKYPEKKWVIDAGALQMIDPKLLTKTCIVTPHKKEMSTLLRKCQKSNAKVQINEKVINELRHLALFRTYELELRTLLSSGVKVLFKGQTDYVFSNELIEVIAGGNAGMTKGGTGDVLSGLLAALYCKHDALTAAVVASYMNKKTGEELYKTVGPYFNASDLVSKLPEVFYRNLCDNNLG